MKMSFKVTHTDTHTQEIVFLHRQELASIFIFLLSFQLMIIYMLIAAICIELKQLPAKATHGEQQWRYYLNCNLQ